MKRRLHSNVSVPTNSGPVILSVSLPLLLPILAGSQRTFVMDCSGLNRASLGFVL